MFTIYNENEDKMQLVEEPDPSLTYTYADYLKWKFEERVELFKGKICKISPAPNLQHQEVSGLLFLAIGNFLKKQNCKVFHAPFDVRLPVKNRKKDKEITTVVQPDLCVICDHEKLDVRGCIGAPDLVVEILSPGNTKKELRIKHQLYEESGVKEYWVVYPVEESVAVYVHDNSNLKIQHLYAAGDKIKSIAVPGLTININDIFPEPEMENIDV